jgi:hypothetical protein
MGLLSFALFLALCFPLDAQKLVQYENIVNLDQLNDAIKNGPDRKVGFLSHGNFQSVEAFLDGHVEPEIFEDSIELELAVMTGAVLAGNLIS